LPIRQTAVDYSSLCQRTGGTPRFEGFSPKPIDSRKFFFCKLMQVGATWCN